MTSRFKIKIKKAGEEERWADAHSVFAHLMQNYMRAELNGKKPEPYIDKVNNFFSQSGEKWDEWIDALKEAYPNIDIEKELSKAKMWLLSNPKQAKSNFSKYVNNWMSKAMERVKPEEKERVMFGEF